MTTTLSIKGMSCSHCKAAVEEALSAIAGVERAEVDLAAGKAVVAHNGVDVALLKQAVDEAGYEVTSVA